MLDRREKRELDRLSCDEGIARLRVVVEEPIGVRLQPREVGRRERPGAELRRRDSLVGDQAARPALEDSQTGVGGDAVEPGAERRIAPIRGSSLPGPQECLLECILRILERAEHPVGVNLELAAVALDELGERRLVAGRRGLDDVLLHHSDVIRAGPETHRCAQSLSAARAGGGLLPCALPPS
jgi:hypothetical protein